MQKSPRSPTCLKCGKQMRFTLVKTGGRKFRCIDCDVPDPSPEVAALLTGALKGPQ